MYVVGNWKMHGLRAGAEGLTQDIAGYLRERHLGARCVLCPPVTLIAQVAEWVADIKSCDVGAQDCHTDIQGEYTGDVSAAMLVDAGARYVILGHSERRAHYGETDVTVKAKAQAAVDAGVTPIICVGESLEQYEANQTLSVVEAQAVACVPDQEMEEVIIAYEPIWAIGSGRMPTLGEIEVVHSAIIAFLAEKKGIAPERVSVLYGGSVKPVNAHEIMQIPDVGGVLVGGASLSADEFCQILAASEVR